MFKSGLEKLDFYAKLLGEETPIVKQCKEIAFYCKDQIPAALRILESECIQRGIDVINPPKFQIEPTENMENSIHLGYSLLNGEPYKPFYIPLKRLCLSIGCYGKSGFGKTSTIAGLTLDALNLYGVPSVYFDTEDSFPKLIKIIDPDKFWVLDVNTGKENPLEPVPGFTTDEWRGRFVTWMRHMMLMEGSINLLDEIAENAYKTVAALGRKYPTLTDLTAAIKIRNWKPQSRHYGYMESTLDRLHRVSQISCFNVETGYDMHELVKRSVCYRIKNLPADLQVMFVTLKLIKLSAYYERN